MATLTENQVSFARELAEELEDVTALDILDSLASMGLVLSEHKGEGNPASEAYMSLIAKSAKR